MEKIETIVLKHDRFARLPELDSGDFSSEIHQLLLSVRDEYNTNASKDKPVLKLHQTIAHDYLMYSKARGLIANHGLGSGKSILAAAVAETGIVMGFPVVFISNKSLHGNFLDNVAKYYDMQGKKLPEDHVERHYTFITINASNMLKQLQKLNRGMALTDKISGSTDIGVNPLDGKVVIVDEVHDFLNSITNASENAVGLYYLLRDAVRCKILLMSGSLNVNSVFETLLGLNVVAGYTLFGEDYDDFRNKWIVNGESLDDDANPESRLPVLNPAVKGKLAARMAGLVSTYNVPPEEAKLYFPTAEPITVINCPMSPYQYSNYVIAREKELEEVARSFSAAKTSALARAGNSSNSTYKIYSRQISYFMYPEKYCYFGKRDGKMIYERDVENFKKTGGEYMTPAQLPKYSTKIFNILVAMSAHAPGGYLEPYKAYAKRVDKKLLDYAAIQAKGVGPGNLYVEFVENGIVPLTMALEAVGLTHYAMPEGETTSEKGRYIVISGDVEPELRAQYINAFKSPANIEGKVIFLLIYTGTGVQGLDTKYVRHTHADPYWNYTRIAQHIGRARRYLSHVDLPEDRRNFANYMYLSDYPEDVKKDDPLYQSEKTTNWVMYRSSIINEYPNKQMRRLTETASIDCGIYSPDADCRICRPIGGKSYARDVSADYKLPDTCQYLYGERVEMVPLTITSYSGEVTYYYNKVGKNIRIFNSDKIEIPQHNTEYKFVLGYINT